MPGLAIASRTAYTAQLRSRRTVGRNLGTREAGPDIARLAGRRKELEAVMKVVGAALDAGVHVVQVKADRGAGRVGRVGARGVHISPREPSSVKRAQ